jgi:glucan phosphoethanolaminetransferase (alkaline phosphatase superfamily)
LAAFLATLGAINLGSLLFVIYQAYQARNISTDLQESSYIFMAMPLILMVSFIGIPIMVIAQNNSSASYFTAAGIIFVICISILVLIYVPKVIALKEKEHLRNASSVCSSIPSTSQHSDNGNEGIKILSTDAGWTGREKSWVIKPKHETTKAAEER